MRKLLLILLQIGFLLSIQSHSVAGDDFRRPFKEGDYFEYIFRDYSSFPPDTFRYSAEVISDSLIDGIYTSIIQIYNEPGMGNYSLTYKFDTTNLRLYGGIPGCQDPNGNQLALGFNLPIGYVWNTCNDTLGGIFFRSTISDTITLNDIIGSGIPLKTVTRHDTAGTPVENYTDYIYSEMFGFVYYYRSSGSPIGFADYDKIIVGAKIDGVTYGSILLSVNQISNEIPANFQLHQNYPNPFNPSTKIKFAILKSGGVRLRVFDPLGREVRTLVNAELTVGSYEYEFDGSGLASGVYFYRLEAGENTQTKRMILLK